MTLLSEANSRHPRLCDEIFLGTSLKYRSDVATYPMQHSTAFEVASYNHVVGLKIVGEMLTLETNRVTIADGVDQYGLTIPRISYSWCDDDLRLGGVNPSLTIQAIGCRTADKIKVLAGRGEL